MLVGEFRRQGIDTTELRSINIDIDRLTLNLVNRHVRTLVPTLFAHDPWIDCLPPTDADAPNAPIWEGLINHSLPLMKFKREIKRCVTDAVVYGEGWKKYGWAGRQRYDERSEGPTADGPVAAPPTDFFSQALSMSGYLTGGSQPTSTNSSRRGTSGRNRLPKSTSEAGGDPITWLLKDGPFVSRLAPHNVVVDPLVPDRDPLNARFLAIRYLKPLSEIRATPGYKVPKILSDKNTLRTQSSPFLFTPGFPRGERDKLEEERQFPEYLHMGVLWEVWVYDLVDLGVHRRVITLLEGAETPIREVSWESMLGTADSGYPIHRLAFNDVPDEPPMSEIESIADIQHMLTWLVRKTLANCNRFSRMGVINEKALSEPGIAQEQLRLGADGTFIKVKGDPTNVVVPIVFPTMSSDANNMISLMFDAFDRVGGVSENRKGETGARTATEAKIIEGGQNVSTSEKLSIVQDFCEDGVYTLISMFQAFVDRDYVVRRVGSGGAVEWMKFGPDNLNGEVPSIKVRFESTKFANEQKELQKNTAVLQSAIQLKPFLPWLRLDIVYFNYLKSLQVDNATAIMGNPLQASQREQQCLEIIQMLAGIPTSTTMGEDDTAHIAVIDIYLASPAAANAQQTNPMGHAAVLMHKDQHIAQLDQLKQQESAAGEAGQMGALDSATGNELSPANQARGEAQRSETETPVPAAVGASNER